MTIKHAGQIARKNMHDDLIEVRTMGMPTSMHSTVQMSLTVSLTRS